MNIQDIKNKLIFALGGKKRGRKSRLLNRQGPDRISMEMDKLVGAAYNALDPVCPDRLDLLAIYFNTLEKTAKLFRSTKRPPPS